MNKLFKEIFEGFNKAQDIARQISKENEPKETEEEKEYCEQCGENLPKEHICFTCCGDEITGDVEDIGLCPTCLEHI